MDTAAKIHTFRADLAMDVLKLAADCTVVLDAD